MIWDAYYLGVFYLVCLFTCSSFNTPSHLPFLLCPSIFLQLPDFLFYCLHSFLPSGAVPHHPFPLQDHSSFLPILWIMPVVLALYAPCREEGMLYLLGGTYLPQPSPPSPIHSHRWRGGGGGGAQGRPYACPFSRACLTLPLPTLHLCPFPLPPFLPFVPPCIPSGLIHSSSSCSPMPPVLIHPSSPYHLPGRRRRAVGGCPTMPHTLTTCLPTPFPTILLCLDGRCLPHLLMEMDGEGVLPHSAWKLPHVPSLLVACDTWEMGWEASQQAPCPCLPHPRTTPRPFPHPTTTQHCLPPAHWAPFRTCVCLPVPLTYHFPHPCLPLPLAILPAGMPLPEGDGGAWEGDYLPHSPSHSPYRDPLVAVLPLYILPAHTYLAFSPSCPALPSPCDGVIICWFGVGGLHTQLPCPGRMGIVVGRWCLQWMGDTPALYPASSLHIPLPTGVPLPSPPPCPLYLTACPSGGGIWPFVGSVGGPRWWRRPCLPCPASPPPIALPPIPFPTPTCLCPSPPSLPACRREGGETFPALPHEAMSPLLPGPSLPHSHIALALPSWFGKIGLGKFVPFDC